MSDFLYRLFANRVYFLIGLVVVVFAIMAGLSPYFLTADNLLGMTRFGAALALVALGQTLIIIAGGGGIDLSVGSMVSLSGVAVGLYMKWGLDIWLAVLLGLLTGIILGAVNGLVVVRIGVPPLIGTLGTLYVYAALALVATGGLPISGFPEGFGFLGQGTILLVPAQILLVVLPVYLVLQFITARTTFGRQVYLVGVNAVAARFVGISVQTVRFALYTLSGLLAALAAVILSSWLMAARPDVGSGLELQAITVAVLGGTDIFGGRGSLAGTMLAVLVVTAVSSGLQLANVNSTWQLAILGLILLASVSTNQYVAARTARQRGAAA